MTQAHSLNSDHWPTKFAIDRSAWLGNLWSLPLIGVLACGYWFFHTANGCITPPIWDLGFFFSSCCGLLVVVTLISQAHSLNSDHRPMKLVVDWSAWLWNPWSSLLIGVLACGYWFFHAANGCITPPIGDLGFFFLAVDWWWWWWCWSWLWLWLWGKRLEIWFFFFFFAVEWWWWCWWWLWLWLCLYLMVGYIILLEWLYYFIVMYILFYCVKS